MFQTLPGVRSVLTSPYFIPVQGWRSRGVDIDQSQRSTIWGLQFTSRRLHASGHRWCRTVRRGSGEIAANPAGGQQIQLNSADVESIREFGWIWMRFCHALWGLRVEVKNDVKLISQSGQWHTYSLDIEQYTRCYEFDTISSNYMNSAYWKYRIWIFKGLLTPSDFVRLKYLTEYKIITRQYNLRLSRRS